MLVRFFVLFLFDRLELLLFELEGAVVNEFLGGFQLGLFGQLLSFKLDLVELVVALRVEV